jgi:MFS family permease
MPSSSAPAATVALTCVPAFMVGLDNLVVVTALAPMRDDLRASVEQLSWTVNAYVLSVGVLMLTGAVLGDRLGRRRMFVAGLLLFSAASAAAALAPSAGWLIAARAIQGAGAALIMPLSLTLLSAAFPPNHRGAAIGAWSAIIGTAVAIGPLVGGAIVEGFSWRWIFWINVPIVRGFKMSVHAAARWYSWINPPSRSRRLISPRLGGGSAVVELGVSSASPR